MTRSVTRTLGAAALVACAACPDPLYGERPADTGPVGDAEPATWAEVRALFDTHCTLCHPSVARVLDLPEDVEAELSTADDDDNVYVVPGDPAGSRLVQHLFELEGAAVMPPGGRLPDADLDPVWAWVAVGAPLD